MAKILKFSIWELMLIGVVILLFGIPLYVNFHKGFNLFESRERTSVTVIRVASPKTDNLNLEKYQMDGVVYASALAPQVPLYVASFNDLLRFDQTEIWIDQGVDDEALINLTTIPKIEPMHSFNERILLVTGRRLANGAQ